MRDVLIVIPARLGSTRFPRKVLADLHGMPVVQHCWNAALMMNSALVVATESQEVERIVKGFDGGRAVLTSADCQSGTDRVHEAALLLERERKSPFKKVINLQGDEPFISSEAIRKVIELLEKPGVDIATAVTDLDWRRAQEPSVVKAKLDENGRCLDFFRVPPPSEDGRFFQHIGIYGYTRQALKRFVGLKPSKRELERKLEQMRAMDDGMSLWAVCVEHSVPIAIDTPEDLRRANQVFNERSLNRSHHG